MRNDRVGEHEYYPQLDNDAPHSLRTAIQRIYQQHYALCMKVDKTGGAIPSVPSMATIRDALQAIGVAPLNVQGLLGVLSQPQIAGAPGYSTAAFPSGNSGDPNVQANALLVDSTLMHLFWVDGSTSPPTIIDLTASGGVTSVGLSVPSSLSVAGSPVTTTGTLAVTEAALTYARALDADTAAVTANANVTTDQNLIAYTVGAGTFNTLTKTLRMYGAGIYTTQAGETPTVRLRVFLGGVQILSWTSAATTASATDIAWSLDSWITVSTIGASGKVEAHGIATVTLGTTPGVAAAVYQDAITAASAAIDLTAAASLQVTGRFSTQPGAAPRNSITQRLLVVERLN